MVKAETSKSSKNSKASTKKSTRGKKPAKFHGLNPRKSEFLTPKNHPRWTFYIFTTGHKFAGLVHGNNLNAASSAALKSLFTKRWKNWKSGTTINFLLSDKKSDGKFVKATWRGEMTNTNFAIFHFGDARAKATTAAKSSTKSKKSSGKGSSVKSSRKSTKK